MHSTGCRHLFATLARLLTVIGGLGLTTSCVGSPRLWIYHDHMGLPCRTCHGKRHVGKTNLLPMQIPLARFHPVPTRPVFHPIHAPTGVEPLDEPPPPGMPAPPGDEPEPLPEPKQPARRASFTESSRRRARAVFHTDHAASDIGTEPSSGATSRPPCCRASNTPSLRFVD